MPKMDGWNLVEKIKRDFRFKTLPVIMVSSLDSEEDQKRGLRLGAAAYIVKQQFEQTELLAVIDQLL
jgi:two-component system, chemotaxis family, sensor kinase CheA